MYLICYDIADDHVRQRVATVLGGFGTRVQESVFECRLGSTEFERLCALLVKEFPTPGHGSIRVYRLCDDCDRVSIRIGAPATGDDGQACVVL